MSVRIVAPDPFFLAALQMLRVADSHCLLPTFPSKPAGEMEIKPVEPKSWFGLSFMKLESPDKGATIRIINLRKLGMKVVFFVGGVYESRLVPNGGYIPLDAGTPFTFVTQNILKFAFEITGTGQVVPHTD